jgi:hypothetical protein
VGNFQFKKEILISAQQAVNLSTVHIRYLRTRLSQVADEICPRELMRFDARMKFDEWMRFNEKMRFDARMKFDARMRFNAWMRFTVT